MGLRQGGGWRGALAVLPLLAVLIAPAAAPAASLQQQFGKADPGSTISVDHSAWDALLQTYLVPGADGLTRVDYARFKKEGRGPLGAYLEALQSADVTKLNKAEQFAFWANLYNAKTIDIVLDHYPVESIRDIRLSGFLFPGPWREKVVTVNGTGLSLNDIEHEILRRLWRDPRIHYAVNCASVGCPNLPLRAFTGITLEAMLEAAARAYVASPRGVRLEGDGAVVSKIYDWFQEDFGGSEEGVLAHIRRYAGPERASRIGQVTRIAGYEYDWSLNDAK